MTPDPDLLHRLDATMAERDLRYNERFDAQEKANRLALDAAQKATDAAFAAAKEAAQLLAASTEKWQAISNEWRGAMDDRERKFLTRDEYEEARKALRAFVLAVVATSTTLLGVLVAGIALATR